MHIVLRVSHVTFVVNCPSSRLARMPFSGSQKSRKTPLRSSMYRGQCAARAVVVALRRAVAVPMAAVRQPVAGSAAALSALSKTRRDELQYSLVNPRRAHQQGMSGASLQPALSRGRAACTQALGRWSRLIMAHSRPRIEYVRCVLSMVASGVVCG